MTEFGMIFPFVTTQSHGGPHEDNAYVCGLEMGLLHVGLPTRIGEAFTVMLHRVNLRQADLIAAHHGWILEEIPISPDLDAEVRVEWARCLFSRSPSIEQGGPT